MAVEAEEFANWFIGGIGALLLWSVLSSLINTQRPKSQKRIITGIAIINGFLLELGVSPVGTLAAELVSLTPVLSVGFSNLVQILILVGTVFELLYGISKMWEGSGWLGIFAFCSGFIRDLILLYYPQIAVPLIFFAILSLEIAPANQWVRR